MTRAVNPSPDMCERCGHSWSHHYECLYCMVDGCVCGPDNAKTEIVQRSACICPFGVLRGDCPEHGELVP